MIKVDPELNTTLQTETCRFRVWDMLQQTSNGATASSIVTEGYAWTIAIDKV